MSQREEKKMDNMTFNFELIDKFTPDVVVKKKIEQVEVVTKGYVKAEIKEYSGPIKSYKKKIPSFQTALSAFQTEEKEVDIQEDLGELDQKRCRFEVFLSVKGLEHYKYRMMFLDYGTISYPVTVVMNEDLAVEYSGRRNATFHIDSMQNLEEMIDQILQSGTMISLIQSLINEALRYENSVESENKE